MTGKAKLNSEHYVIKYMGGRQYCYSIYGTGFWKTNRNVTLGRAYSILLAQLMATLIHYTFTLPLSGLVDWSAFLEQLLPTL